MLDREVPSGMTADEARQINTARAERLIAECVGVDIIKFRNSNLEPKIKAAANSGGNSTRMFSISKSLAKLLAEHGRGLGFKTDPDHDSVRVMW